MTELDLTDLRAALDADSRGWTAAIDNVTVLSLLDRLERAERGLSIANEEKAEALSRGRKAEAAVERLRELADTADEMGRATVPAWQVRAALDGGDRG